MTIPDLYALFLDHPSISTDTRFLQAGDLFFALKGELFDGNAFAAKALESGASYAIVSDPELKGDQIIHVPDTLQALQEMAMLHRTHFSIPVLGITGSNGKTTTKELVARVLSQKYRTHATTGNLNNHIGVPLTLLRIPRDTEVVICEMGANHIGEIAALCQIAQPTHGLITNIGKAHLEGFGSFEGVKRAKGELFEYLSRHQGFAFVNADDASLREISQALPNKLTYGLQEDSEANIHFKYIPENNPTGFTIQDRHGASRIRSTLFGAYNAMNMLAAYTVGKYFQVDEAGLVEQLAQFKSGANRSEVIMIEGCTIVKDAYNANPSSMELALLAFADRYPAGWVILGDMKELGSTAYEAHRHIVELALSKNFKKLFFVGELFGQVLDQMPASGSNVSWTETIEQVKRDWRWDQCKNEALLLKGSRSMHLEKLLE